MYPRIALWRKRVATLLLRPDHTRQQTFAHNPIDVGGRATVRGKYEINFQVATGRMPANGGTMIRISMLSIVFAFAVAAAGAQTFPPQPPPAANQGNDKERAACHPDVTRFCQTQLQVNPNDTLGILGCLQANRPKISRACQQVLASHGQ